jgi:predicted amidohydrolase
MRIAAIQLDITWEDREANFAALRRHVAAAKAQGARLVLFPEMFAYGFSMATDRIAEDEGGPSADFVAALAREHDLWIGGSAPERRPGHTRPHNTFLLASPAGELHRYRKIHPFTFAGEHEHYDAGTEHVVVDIDGLRCGLFVCYDLRFANEFWALATRVDAFFVVANWPARRRHHWSTLLRARAIENQAYVVGVNRVGTGGGLEYSGDSAILDPWGDVLCEATKDETMLLANLDAARVAEARRTFPVLADRRRVAE